MAIQLPDFRSRELPTTRGRTPQTEPTLRPQLTQPGSPAGEQLIKVGDQLSTIATDMKDRWELGRATAMISAFNVDLQKVSDGISPNDYGNRSTQVRDAALNLKNEFLAAAQRQGWRSENISALEKNLTTQAAQAEISALKTARTQEIDWHRNNIPNVIEEQLRRTETRGFNDSDGIVKQGTQTIQQAIDAAKGVIPEADLNRYLNGPRGWFVQKENQYMEHLVERDPERMLGYTTSYSLDGEKYRKQAAGILTSNAGKVKSAFKAKVSALSTTIGNLGDRLSNANDSQWNQGGWVKNAYGSIDALGDEINKMLQSQPASDPSIYNNLTNYRSDLTALRQASHFATMIVKTNDIDQLDQIMSSFEMYAGSDEVGKASGRLATALSKQFPRLKKLVAERKQLIEHSEKTHGTLDAMEDFVASFAKINAFENTQDLAVHKKFLQTLRTELTTINEQTDKKKIRTKQFISSRLKMLNQEIKQTDKRGQALQDVRDIGLIESGEWTGTKQQAEEVYNRVLSRQDAFGEPYGFKLARELITDTGMLGPVTTDIVNITKSAGFVPQPVANVISQHFEQLEVASSDQDLSAAGELIAFVKMLYRTDKTAAEKAIDSNILALAHSTSLDRLKGRSLEWGRAYVNRLAKPGQLPPDIEDSINQMNQFLTGDT
tara:strand:- start:7704 stop:9692 length:1989 start_codon:yes stop_codon:yes gene_type:complete